MAGNWAIVSVNYPNRKWFGRNLVDDVFRSATTNDNDFQTNLLSRKRQRTKRHLAQHYGQESAESAVDLPHRYLPGLME